MGVAELSSGLAAGTFSSEEVTRELLAGMREAGGPGTPGSPGGLDRFNAFLAVTPDEVALAEARRADALRQAGQAGPLTGVPVAHKDIFVTDFERSALHSTAGSKMLAGYQSPFDASVVARLGPGSRDGRLPGAGMVTLGKLNCDEFAMGSGNENSAFGPVRNPWDLGRVPGGSSGGSAAAVARASGRGSPAAAVARWSSRARRSRSWPTAAARSLRPSGRWARPGPGWRQRRSCRSASRCRRWA